MNVIHAVAWYFPESTGGTEVYVSGLVKELSALGITNSVVAASNKSAPFDYVNEGVAVHRYPFADEPVGAFARGERKPRDFDTFVAWLDRQPRGIYHQHSWTTSSGPHHLNAAKSLGFRTVLTAHVPANICVRGTMVEFGTGPCDGRVTTERCAACWSHARGLPGPIARALGRIPMSVSQAACTLSAESRLFTALGSRAMVQLRQRQLATMAEAADRIVAVCDWHAEALRRNGISAEKLTVSRQGVDRGFVGRLPIRRGGNEKFRLGFLGRCDPVKGLPVLLEAVARLPADLVFELVVYAVVNNEPDQRRFDALVEQMAGDPRVKFMPPADRQEIPAVLASLDMLAVPSQWMETGPLVVLEAQACGVPVLGSNMGGIAELITPGVDGFLVKFSDPSAWTEAIQAAVTGALPCGGNTQRGAVRTMAEAARDMAALYAAIK